MMSQQRDFETRVSDARRRRLLARGGACDYADADTFAAVEHILRRVIEERSGSGLIADLLDEEEWHLDPVVRLSSHRRLLGPLILRCKRRLLLPLTRWLYEYAAANFRRQERVNRLLFAYIEELAIENARLRRLAVR